MIVLGTPYIRLFDDSETTLIVICIVFAYTALYFYYLSQQLKKKIKKCEAELRTYTEENETS
ncbi:MAG: cell division protein FtsL [Bacteroidia bacterium]|jgi:cell division protein FtsL